ncbi:MAG: flagellar basal body rod protein FlgC [Limnochordia bacterium]|jgi:flagellar basal-body rod protein FlgC|nr:flagellar basal body rod protein FlgC [Bacillota bacterium]NLL08036.1 flagellar basal body rod protein FlgC [Bacillota bacterium]HBG09965.1 flagellar basal body rod protein FlgC [Bacillota bacterium]
MSAFRIFRIAASGLTAERLRMDTIANNLANANTTRTPEGGPYRRQVPVFAPILDRAVRRGGSPKETFSGGGVQVVGVVSDPSPPRLVYDPQHPDADAEGYVEMPNVHVVKEMVDLITATRAYEANITALNSAKSMAQRALEIGR